MISARNASRYKIRRVAGSFRAGGDRNNALSSWYQTTKMDEPCTAAIFNEGSTVDDVDPTSFSPLRVSNAPDIGLTHEFFVVKTDLAADTLLVKNGQVSESQFKKMGEMENIDPARTSV